MNVVNIINIVNVNIVSSYFQCFHFLFYLRFGRLDGDSNNQVSVELGDNIYQQILYFGFISKTASSLLNNSPTI